MEVNIFIPMDVDGPLQINPDEIPEDQLVDNLDDLLEDQEEQQL